MAVIGKYVLKRRQELGLTQEELAHKMGYKTKSSINKIEAGLQDVPLPKVEELARCLETTPAYLMGWMDDYTLDDGNVLELQSLNEANKSRLLSYYHFLLEHQNEDV